MALPLRKMSLGLGGLIKEEVLLCVQVTTKWFVMVMFSAQVILAVVAVGEILCT